MSNRLAPAGLLLLGTALVLLGLALQELALLIGGHAAQDTLTLLLLDLFGGNFALLGLLLLLDAAQLLDLLLADVAELAHHLAAEVGGGNELIGETQELVEEGQSRGVGRGKVDGKLDTLLGDGLIDPIGG